MVALVGPSIAQAANSFVPAGEIGSGELEGPARIAVDQVSGDVLVVDGTKNRVDVYDSSGPGAALLTTFGESDLSGPYGIAVDPSNGDVYVTDPGSDRVRRYITDGASPPTYTLDAGYTGPAAGTGSEEVGSFSSAIAVDPTDGDLLVADRGNDRVERFSSAGAFVSSFDGSDSPGGPFTHLEDVTLSPAGKIFVADGEAASGAPSRVLRFSNAGAFEATLRSSEPTGDAYLAYDATHTELIVGDGRECFFCNVSIHVLDPSSGATLFDVTVPSEQITGLASDRGSGRLYAISARGEFYAPAKVVVFAPQMHPDLILNPPGPTTDFAAHLSGSVNPRGVATEYQFEISKDGGSTWQKSPEPAAAAGEGTTPVVVETDFSVEPNNHYLARLVASNTEGAQDATPTDSFETGVEPPAVETRPATDIDEASAVVNGTINPFGLQTTYYFEYGPTTAYGIRIPVGPEAVAGQGKGIDSFSRTLSGLAPGTTYHFRLVAKNSAGISDGSDRIFTTAVAGATPVRRYEQVTPPDKHGAIVSASIGYQAKPDGNALSYLTKTGPKSSPIFSRHAVYRSATDWGGDIGTDPPVGVTLTEFNDRYTLAVSSDFTHAFVVSNRALAPGATEGEANLYRSDLRSGTYEFIGGSGAYHAFQSFMGSQTAPFQAGAPDLSWIYFFSRESLLAGAPRYAMYRWSTNGGLELASVLPDGEGTSAVHQQAYTYWQPASADGDRFYFTGFDGSEEGVFLREGNGPTKVVSHLPGDPTTAQPATLLGTDRDGRYAFLVSGAKLTSSAPGLKGDLYRYDADDGSLEYLGASCYIELLFGPDGINPGMGGTLGIGADGDTIYFIEEVAETGFVGAFLVWHKGTVHQVSSGRPGLSQERSSPNGRYFVLQEEVAGVPTLQLYDAETGETRCVSCLLDGAPAEGRLATAGPDFGVSNRFPTSVDDEGTVFFDTAAPLVRADVNGTRDVYSWSAGVPTLISPGDQPVEAILGEATPDGSDVYFTTSQQLVARDTDGSRDIYDARLNGGLPIQNLTAPEECSLSCKPTTPGASGSLSGGSEAVNGPGNVKRQKKHRVCAKGKRKQTVSGKVRCVKRSNKHRKPRHHKPKHHQPNNNKKGGNR